MAKKKKKILWFVIFAVLAVLLVRLFVLSADVLGIGKQGMVRVEIPSGMTDAYSVGQQLQQADVIDSPFVFSLLAKIKGVDGEFIAGAYSLDKSKDYNWFINTLTYDYTYRTVNITIPEGSTIQDIRRIVVETGFVSEKDFEKALGKAYDYPFLKAAHVEQRENSLEGYLFPDTYNISNTMTAEEIIDMMLRRFDEIYTEKYAARAKELGYTDDEILILASIIECEAGSGNDRAKVSSVFHNRLNKPHVYPYLQSCATVQYILGEKKPILSLEDTKIKSPYNTYINKGLPIGPICNPGKAAIEAALYPAQTRYYYFQSDASGKIYYAETLQEHEKIKNEIQ